jgi:hypothetical protein
MKFSEFQEKESSLKQMHEKTMEKGKELAKKMRLEVIAQSSQRGHLLQIINEINEKLALQ